MSSHRFGLISDTHGRLHPDVFRLFHGVEAIFHAGDVVGEDLLDDLAALAPVHAVSGNCDDASPRLPPLAEVEAPFGKVLVSHSHLVPTRGDPAAELAAHFAPRGPRLIVFGHTHRSCCAEHQGIWVVNPGPAGRPRFNERPSVCLLTWDPQSDNFQFDFHRLDWAKIARA